MCRLAIAIFCLFDQFEQTCDFRLGTGFHEMIELIFGQIVLQILHHIEVLPPAIQNFKTGLLVVTAYFAIIKWYGVAQSWATPYQSSVYFLHKSSNGRCCHLKFLIIAGLGYCSSTFSASAISSAGNS